MKHSSFLKALIVLGFLVPSFALAGSEHNMAGWAWSSGTGWVSFNSTNEPSATADYGVNMNGDGTLTGYAWSSGIGWIKFGGLSGFPSGNGTQAVNAQVNGNNVKGWAKAIAADGNGWDGWISLSGAGYGVKFSNGAFSGYAWGSAVIGWVQFDVSAQNPGVCTGNCGVILSGGATFDIQSNGASLNGNNTVPYGTVPTFTWSISNLPSVNCALSKTSSGGTAFNTISGITSSGSSTGSPLISGPYTFSFDCTNPTISSQESFTVASQPAGFSIGSTEGIRIQFLGVPTAVSEQDSVFVTATGGFSNPVTVSVTGFPAPVASTTFSYSLGGGSFSSNPAPVVLTSPYNVGTSFKVRVVQQANAPQITEPFTVTLTGTASGASSAQKTIVVTPVTFNPLYQEH